VLWSRSRGARAFFDVPEPVPELAELWAAPAHFISLQISYFCPSTASAVPELFLFIFYLFIFFPPIHAYAARILTRVLGVGG
jgi:hypothetical protein